MASEPVDSQRIDGPNGVRVQVLFYRDNSIRFRVYRAPLAIEEAFLTGNKQGNAILKLTARPSGIPASFRQLGVKAEVSGMDGPCLLCAQVRGNLYDPVDSSAPLLPIDGCEHERGCSCVYV